MNCSRPVNFYVRALSLCAALGLLLACTQHEVKTNSVESDEIVVAAAANLTDAFGELAKNFTAQTGIRVTYSFGATADLAKQIENGAPFDLFASADLKHVNQLEQKKLLTPGAHALYARGKLVLWTPPESKIQITRLEDLTRPEIIKIAIAKPDLAPYGQAAVEALRAANLWAQAEPKAVYAQNVAQAKQFASTGNADVAFLPRALVKAHEGTTIEIDASLHQPIDQALGIVKASGKQSSAKRFMDFVLSDQGQTLLESYGYGKASQAKL